MDKLRLFFKSPLKFIATFFEEVFKVALKMKGKSEREVDRIVRRVKTGIKIFVLVTTITLVTITTTIINNSQRPNETPPSLSEIESPKEVSKPDPQLEPETLTQISEDLNKSEEEIQERWEETSEAEFHKWVREEYAIINYPKIYNDKRTPKGNPVENGIIVGRYNTFMNMTLGGIELYGPHRALDIISGNFKEKQEKNELIEVRATADGTITRAHRDAPKGDGNSLAGWNVTIDHDIINGHKVETRFYHMLDPGEPYYFNPNDPNEIPTYPPLHAKEGREVKRKDVIGYMGSTGCSTGPHVHYEILIDGVRVDPYPYLYSGKKIGMEIKEEEKKEEEK